MLPVHTHMAHTYLCTPGDLKSVGMGRLNTVRHEHRYLICLHFYVGKDLTHVTHPHSYVWEASLARTDSETDPENPCRVAGFTGMISICRITLPFDLQDFYLAFPSRNMPFARALSQVLKGLILHPPMDMTQNRNCRNKPCSNMAPFGLGWSISRFKQFWGKQRKQSSGWRWRWKCLEVQKSI